MALRVAINGFGRIGRLVLRSIIEHDRTDIEVVAINDLGPVETNAHLLRYDSVHGRFPATVTVDGDTIDVGRGPIRVTAIRNPAELPWGDVDIAMECTGIFASRDKAAVHLENGSKRVLVSAPAGGADKTIVYGVNHDLYDPAQHHTVTAASCTTNCLAPVVKVLHEKIGIDHGSMTTIHDVTNTQTIVDRPAKDMRRARSALNSLIPTTTGSATAITLIYPELKGRLNGHAVRVPLRAPVAPGRAPRSPGRRPVGFRPFALRRRRHGVAEPLHAWFLRRLHVRTEQLHSEASVRRVARRSPTR